VAGTLFKRTMFKLYHMVKQVGIRRSLSDHCGRKNRNYRVGVTVIDRSRQPLISTIAVLIKYRLLVHSGGSLLASTAQKSGLFASTAQKSASGSGTCE
jgi:hypothetical protein